MVAIARNMQRENVQSVSCSKIPGYSSSSSINLAAPPSLHPDLRACVYALRITIPTVDQEGTTTTAPSKSSKNKNASPQIVFKWERRKRGSDAYAPSLRSGCTMSLWNRSGGAGATGVLFGGVTDEDTNEETLESVFHNDLFVFFSHVNSPG